MGACAAKPATSEETPPSASASVAQASGSKNVPTTSNAVAVATTDRHDTSAKGVLSKVAEKTTDLLEQVVPPVEETGDTPPTVEDSSKIDTAAESPLNDATNETPGKTEIEESPANGDDKARELPEAETKQAEGDDMLGKILEKTGEVFMAAEHKEPTEESPAESKPVADIDQHIELDTTDSTADTVVKESAANREAPDEENDAVKSLAAVAMANAVASAESEERDIPGLGDSDSPLPESSEPQVDEQVDEQEAAPNIIDAAAEEDHEIEINSVSVEMFSHEEEPAVSEAKPEISEAKPEISEAKPEISEAEPDIPEGGPVPPAEAVPSETSPEEADLTGGITPAIAVLAGGITATSGAVLAAAFADADATSEPATAEPPDPSVEAPAKKVEAPAKKVEEPEKKVEAPAPVSPRIESAPYAMEEDDSRSEFSTMSSRYSSLPPVPRRVVKKRAPKGRKPIPGELAAKPELKPPSKFATEAEKKTVEDAKQGFVTIKVWRLGNPRMEEPVTMMKVKKRFRQWDKFMTTLSDQVNEAVDNSQTNDKLHRITRLYTMEGSPVRGLDELQPGTTYVCSGRLKFSTKLIPKRALE